jgi:hypothetical protein
MTAQLPLTMRASQSRQPIGRIYQVGDPRRARAGLRSTRRQ